MRSLLTLSFLLLIVACSDRNDTKKVVISEKNALDELVDQIHKERGANCFSIGLIKKNDCLSCEVSATKFFSDTATLKSAVLINEDIRAVERPDYLEKHSFLKKAQHQYNSDLISKIAKELKIKFSSTIIIVVNEQGKIIQKGYLRELGQKADFSESLCWRN